MLKRINKILPELILEIAVYGLIAQLVGMWLVKDKLYYTIGLWIGIAIAAGMAIHMAVVILDTVDMAAQKQARVRTTLFSVLRYIVVVLLFVVVLVFDLGNVLAMFVGVMGLKAAAYLQPFTHKLLEKCYKKNDMYRKADKHAKM